MLPPFVYRTLKKTRVTPTHPVLRVALGHLRNWAFSFLLLRRLPRSPGRTLARSFPARICTNLDYTYTNCGGKFAQKLTSSIQFVAVIFMGFFCYLGHVMEEEEEENDNPKTEVDCRNKYISPLNNVQHTQQTHSRTTTTTTTTSTSSRKEEEEQPPPPQQQQQQQQQVAPAEEEFGC